MTGRTRNPLKTAKPSPLPVGVSDNAGWPALTGGGKPLERKELCTNTTL